MFTSSGMTIQIMGIFFIFLLILLRFIYLSTANLEYWDSKLSCKVFGTNVFTLQIILFSFYEKQTDDISFTILVFWLLTSTCLAFLLF